LMFSSSNGYRAHLPLHWILMNPFQF
jgi:hypothetical protein